MFCSHAVVEEADLVAWAHDRSFVVGAGGFFLITAVVLHAQSPEMRSLVAAHHLRTSNDVTGSFKALQL
jgi:hypothetical protein